MTCKMITLMMVTVILFAATNATFANYVAGHVERVELSCLQDHMRIDITTDNSFNGVIYTRGSYRIEECYIDAKSGNRFQLIFPLTGCKTEEIDGIFSNVLILQNDDNLMTLDDVAFSLKCDHRKIRAFALDAINNPIEVANDSKPIVASVSEQDLQNLRITTSTAHSNGTSTATFTFGSVKPK